MEPERLRIALKIGLVIVLIAFLILFARDELDFVYQGF
jgi:hypothetical protein